MNALPAAPLPRVREFPGPGHGNAQPRTGGVAEALRRFMATSPAAERVRRFTGASLSDEIRGQTELVAEIQRPMTTPRRIAVTSQEPGIGQTTVAILVAFALAHFRRDRVLLIDADPRPPFSRPGGGPHKVASRLGLTPGASLRELAEARPGSFEELKPFLTSTGPGLWVLSAADREADGQALERHRAAVAALTRFFTITVVDCGTGLDTELASGIVADAHARLMAGQPGITYDEELARAGVIDPDQIGKDARTAAVRLAARALQQATNGGTR